MNLVILLLIAAVIGIAILFVIIKLLSILVDARIVQEKEEH